MALLARGEAGLTAAADDVLKVGGEALALTVDVADRSAVEAAASRVEDELGPLDFLLSSVPRRLQRG